MLSSSSTTSSRMFAFDMVFLSVRFGVVALGGPGHAELGPLAEPRVDLDGPAVRRHDLADEVQAEPRPLAGLLRGEEGVEGAVAHLRRHPAPRVADAEADRPAVR